jgi:hypothetical protein
VEDTQKCPHCGDGITPTDPKASGGRRWVFVAAVVLMVVLMLMYAL